MVEAGAMAARRSDEVAMDNMVDGEESESNEGLAVVFVNRVMVLRSWNYDESES